MTVATEKQLQALAQQAEQLPIASYLVGPVRCQRTAALVADTDTGDRTSVYKCFVGTAGAAARFCLVGVGQSRACFIDIFTACYPLGLSVLLLHTYINTY